MSSSSSTTQSNKENETTKNIDEDIFLSLEPFEDRQIDHFEEDGKEIYVKYVFHTILLCEFTHI